MTRNELNTAKQMLKNYDLLVAEVRNHEAKVDAIFDKLEEEGVNADTEEGENIANARLFAAGLSDENGQTDLYVKRSEARVNLVNYIIDHIVGKMIPEQDREALCCANISYQFKIIDLTRKLLAA